MSYGMSIQIARTPKDPRAKMQIQKYFWVLVRVSYGRRCPSVIVVLTPDKRCAAVRVLQVPHVWLAGLIRILFLDAWSVRDVWHVLCHAASVCECCSEEAQ